MGRRAKNGNLVVVSQWPMGHDEWSVWLEIGEEWHMYGLIVRLVILRSAEH